METIRNIPTLAELEAPEDAVLVVDASFARHHGWTREATVFVEAGESLKTLSRVEELAERVLDVRSTKPMTLVAVGGGSVGDAAGFLASVLWRGVKLWHVPTTLLAAADSAHGGKTAVNLGTHKNQLGTFWPAEVVVLVDEIFAALPAPLRAEGLAEIIKGLWLGAPQDLSLLDAHGVDTLAFGPWELVGPSVMEVLQSAIRVKQSIVERDPREELGVRTLLNLGHTLAHALELEDGYAHGRAVAWGMAAAAEVSNRRGLLSANHLAKLWRHVHPLLGARLPTLTRDKMSAALGKDKKRIDSRLRSVLLRGPGDAFVVDDVSDDDWFEALDAVRARGDAPIEVTYRPGWHSTVSVEASKSVMNRLLAVARLRPGSTVVAGESDAEDVRNMRAALAAYEQGADIAVGEGGTTYRFMLAVVAAGSVPATLARGARLSQRPHDALHEALRRAGARVIEEGTLVHVTPLPPGNLAFEVDARESSQFASSLALIACSGRTVTLRLPHGVASRPYFDMTLALLRQAGIAIEWTATDVVRLEPGPALHEPVTLEAEPDASSAAVWAVARRLGVQVDTAGPPTALQPDAQVEDCLWTDDETDVARDLREAPDLAPILTAAAALTPSRVSLCGAGHLRHKESNRIEDLVSSFGAVGIEVFPLEDGLEIPAGVQRPTTSPFPTHGDHRLAMAACLLAIGAPVTVAHPAVVAKSYPEFWRDAMMAGFSVRPAG